jgi:hypothetical protein
MRIGYSRRTRRGSMFASMGFGTAVILSPVLLMGLFFEGSVKFAVWVVKALIALYVGPVKLAWRAHKRNAYSRRINQHGVV